MTDKTPAQWLEEIARLGAEVNTKSALLEEKRAAKRELSLAAANGDAAAIKAVRALADEIDALQWSCGLLDDALIVANRKLQESEKLARDARITAILAERDRVEAERDALYPRIRAAVADLVGLYRATDIKARELYTLSLDAGQEAAGMAYLRATRRTVGGYITMELGQARVEGVERPLSGPFRDELRKTFGVTATPENGESNEN